MRIVLLVRVLGPTTVTRDAGDDLAVGARRHAEVLAILAAHHHRPVRAPALADLVWRGKPPPSAATTLQGYIARLRRLLEPGRPGSASSAIVTVGDGYRLDLDTDAARFEVDVRQGRDLIASAPARAAAMLGAALATWHGAAYADVADIDAMAPEIQRLDELRVVAREAHAQALLAAGEDAAVVPELRVLVAEHQLRERGAALLATALYRCGRQADALAVLRDLRERLVDELGVDPGPEIADLERRLLTQDPALLARPTAAGATGGDFAGRRQEMATLRSAFDRARAGALRTAVIRGEAGIGKTRLVQEFLEAVVIPSGGVARWARCPAAPGAPTFWPWTQVLGDLPVPDAGMEAGRFAFGLELGRRLGDLARDAGTRGAVVVLDDAQWADADSLHVLEIALDALDSVPLLLILTARDDPPRAPEELDRVLGSLARRADHVDLRLAGLTEDDAASLLAALGGRGGTPEAARRLVARTGGNPYFLRSLAALDPDAEVPGNVRDTVRARVAALPDGGHDLLRALSLAGRDLPVTIAAAAAGRSLEAIGNVLVSALRGGLVEEPAPGLLRVAHDIVREAVAGDIEPTARVAMHTRLADSLAASGAPSATIAGHRLAAAAGSADGRAAECALVAAREALAGAALDEAVSWAQAGLTAAMDPRVRADLHRVAGIAARRAGRLEISEDELRQEAEIARSSGDWTRLAEAALESVPGGIGGYWSLFGMPMLGASALLGEALLHSGELPAPLRARLLAAQATQLAGSGQVGSAELAERALAEARDDVEARARALVSVLLATWTPDTAPRRLAQVEELRALSAHDAGLQATAAHLERCVLLELGRLHESAQASRRFTAIAQRSHDPDLALLDTWWEVGLRLLRGDAEEARRLAQVAADAAALASPAAATLDLISRSTVEGIAAWHEGRLVNLVGDATNLATGTDPAFLLVVALGHAEAGDRDVALPLIDQLLAAPPDGQRRAPWAVMLASALIALGDAGRLTTLLPALRSFGRQIVVLWPGMVTLGPAQLYLGGALAVTGETAEARRVLSSAVEQANSIGARPYVARARRLLEALPA